MAQNRGIDDPPPMRPPRDPPARDAMIGTLLNARFRLEERLGSGGMSTVYRAFDETLERWVAIKLMHREYSSVPDQLERFRREARSAAGLSHPHVVTVIDAGEDAGHPYIVLEYVEGETLKDRIRREGALPAGEAVAYAIEIGRGLEAAHGARLVHRDIKPQNVLLDTEGRAKVTDFGIARSLEADGMTQAGRVLGTTDYVSPEQALGETVTEQSDIYSLGICLYEMLAGSVPFGGDTHVAVAMKHVRDPMPDIRGSRPDISASLAAVLERSTAKERKNRYATVGQLVDDLESVLAIEAARTGETTGEATSVLQGLPAGHADVAPGRLRHPRRLLGLALLGIAAVAVAAVVLASRVEEGRTGGADPPGQPDLQRVSLASSAIGEFDPEATGGDGSESPDSVTNVIDDNPSTIWDTETYQCEDYGCDFTAEGAPKPGVGLTVDAGDPVAARRLDLTVASAAGWNVEVYGANSVPDSLDGWGEPIGSVDGLSEEQAIELDTGGEEHRYYLVWITSLPDDGQAAIAELTLRQ
jgi:serine/threonine-protein kinase